MSDVFIYQIKPPYADQKDLDPGFLLLDNTANERPDWYEYWPIRNFLLKETLDEDSFYGFVSPRFKEKTNLSATAAIEFVRGAGQNADVVLLSPTLCWTAVYWNVFEFGDAVHPGLLAVSSEFFTRIGQPTNLTSLVTHSQNEVYSNYAIAKPRFWRAWLEVNEQLFAIAESPTDPLGERLRSATVYRGKLGAHMKIFLMERIATWLLVRDTQFTARVRDPFVTKKRMYKLPVAVICDALKIAYTTSGRRGQYKDLFDLVSGLGKTINWQMRIGGALRFPTVRTGLQRLHSYWTRLNGS
jgi:hypothetical protein